MTKPGKMGPNSPFMEMELAIGHKSSRNAEKNAKNRIFISKTVIFYNILTIFIRKGLILRKMQSKIP